MKIQIRLLVATFVAINVYFICFNLIAKLIGEVTAGSLSFVWVIAAVVVVVAVCTNWSNLSRWEKEQKEQKAEKDKQKPPSMPNYL